MSGVSPHIVQEQIVWEKYFSIYRRQVNLSGKLVAFDVIGHPASNFCAALVFPFDTKNKTATLVKEYYPGDNSMLYSFPGGLFDPKKHESILATAKAELNEEARLVSNEWYPLTGEQGILQDKYSRNRLHMFLALNGEKISDYDCRDAEEYIETVEDVDIHKLPEWICQGKMAVASSCLFWLGWEKLKQMR